MLHNVTGVWVWRFEKFADRHFYHSCNLCKVRGYLVVQLAVSTVSPLAQLFSPLLSWTEQTELVWSPASKPKPKHCIQQH